MTRPIQRLIVWGGAGGDLDSFRHIHRAYHLTARKLGIQTLWVEDEEKNRAFITPGSTVLAVDRWGKNIAPAVPGVDYVLHNFDGAHPLCQQLEQTPERLLRIQVFTNDSLRAGAQWDIARLFDREGRVLYQPWGSDLLAEEFLEPVFNPTSREVAYVGAIWSDLYEGADLGNYAMIQELRSICADLGLQFVHRTQISDEENVATVRGSRLAPAFAGGWQVGHNYLPCRVFKNAAYGVLAITNVPLAATLFGSPATSIGALVDEALRMKEQEVLELVREQQLVAARYTYRQSIESIERAFEEIRS